MKNLKMKALSLGIVSSILISSSVCAATPAVYPSHPVPKTSEPTIAGSNAIQTPTISKAAIHPSFNYGPNGGPNIVTILNEGGIVQEGDVGYVVKEIQTALYYYFFENYINIYIEYGISDDSSFIDGYFGGKTDALVRQFQLLNGLTVDGKVGSDTWAKMGPWDK